MSNGLFNDPRMDAAWRAYADADARLAPPRTLEARTLSRCSSARALERSSAPPRRGRWLGVTAGLATAASVAMGIVLSGPRSEPAVVPIEARAHGVTMLADGVSADRPVVAVAPIGRGKMNKPAAPANEPVELSEVLMQLDLTPMRAHEPLQMVRLRLPREALQALGLALLEPDAGGLVDVDVLVGEDGLPRDIRQVRFGQEQR